MLSATFFLAYLAAMELQGIEIDLVLYGKIDYRDIFRASRSTTFCYFLNASGAAFCDCHNEIDPGEKH